MALPAECSDMCSYVNTDPEIKYFALISFFFLVFTHAPSHLTSKISILSANTLIFIEIGFNSQTQRCSQLWRSYWFLMTTVYVSLLIHFSRCAIEVWRLVLVSWLVKNEDKKWLRFVTNENTAWEKIVFFSLEIFLYILRLILLHFFFCFFRSNT